MSKVCQLYALETEGYRLCALARSGCYPHRHPLECITINMQAESLGRVRAHGP